MIVAAIARNTFREATRDRVVTGVVLFGIAAMLLTQLLSPLALGEGHRLTIDLGLTSISVLGMLVVLLAGSSLISKEIEKRTIYNLLSRPIGRPVYLTGKWAGMAGALWVVAATLGAALWALLALRGHAGHGPSLAQAVYLAGLELTVLTSLVVMFSALSTPVLSALYTLGAYCLGQWSGDLRGFAHQFPPGIAGAIEVVANLVPNLPIFNMRSLAAAGDTTSGFHLGVASGYAAVYCACVLCLAAAAFESRDFK
ncbi:MAG TPA: ABC transporter permease subunit [Candidatus Limnocylindria bacterium]|nr:ABC transporter permease subunit [Candidatus Limnocylindria bacterium]